MAGGVFNGTNFACYHIQMRSKIIHIILLAVAFILAFSVSPSPAQDVPSQHEQDLLQLINEARENPLIVATSLGMDAEQILQDLPELKDILTNGLPPLSFNENLYAAAGAHTRDMLEHGYYSHISLDGRTFEERIRASGYVPTATGESLGMLAFFNFIQPAKAVELIFENMFRDELDPARTERRNILASDLEEAGIALGTGALQLAGSACNVYLVTCDFGFGVGEIEMELLNLINQARRCPLEAAVSAGLDPDQILADLPELRGILSEGLPPLSFNKNLYAAAGAHARDMLENGYYSHDSLDGRTAEDRIRESGYDDPLTTGESIGLACLCGDRTPEECAYRLFKQILTAELRPDCSIDRNILNPDLREAAISLVAGTSSELGGICGDEVLLMTVDFGAGAAEKAPALAGVVYSDLNGDGIYSMGEGLERVAVEIEGESGHFSVYTNEAGGFSLSLPSGAYRLAVMAGEEEMIRYIDIGSENRLVIFRSCPGSD